MLIIFSYYVHKYEKKLIGQEHKMVKIYRLTFMHVFLHLEQRWDEHCWEQRFHFVFMATSLPKYFSAFPKDTHLVR